jgi:hypothetical protein
MEKLKNIILQLDETRYKSIQDSLIANHSNKFLTVLTYYRGNKSGDLNVVLNSKENTTNVLKSRLYDRIQKFLLENLDSPDKTEGEKQVDYFDNFLTEYPRDTATAMLHEFEKKHQQSNDFLNLINVYSTLKKAYHFSDKFYHYSQLYNKHVAYAISLEKAYDVLLSFNKTLANYYFSGAETDLQMLMIYKDEIKNICFLSKSRDSELIYNIIIVQLYLFADVELPDEDSADDLLQASENIIREKASDPQIGKFGKVITFLQLEYYKKINQAKKILYFYEKLDESSEKWLLNNNYCLAFKFLFTKLEFIANKELPKHKDGVEMLFDSYDYYSIVSLKFYLAVKSYYDGNIKDAIAGLNKILESSSFVNFPYMDFEVKLTLAYFYYKKNEYELAGNLVKNLSRKVSAPEYSQYASVKSFIKILNQLIDGKGSKTPSAKIVTLFEQFNYNNFNGRKILQHIQKDLEKLYKNTIKLN